MVRVCIRVEDVEFEIILLLSVCLSVCVFLMFVCLCLVDVSYSCESEWGDLTALAHLYKRLLALQVSI